MRHLSLIFIVFFLAACTAKNTVPNILLLPKNVTLDQTNARLFVADSENNNFSLIDVTTNSIVTGAPLLNINSTLQLPQLPQDIAAVDLGNGATRIFIIGSGPAPTNQITVFDYSSSSGLTVAPISPLTVGSGSSDILLGLAIDATGGNLFVSNSTASMVRIYNINTGAEVTGSPMSVASQPAKIEFNASINRLFVSSMGTNTLSIIDTQNLSLAAASLDVGVKTSSVASATNSNGTALFVLDPFNNQIKVYNYNVASPSSSTQIGSTVTPPTPGNTPSSTDVLTGAAANLAAASLANGQIAGLVTQSSGDLGFIDVSSDLTSFGQGRVSVLNGLNASGIDILKDSSGNGTHAYFAAPGGSAVSIVNITTNQYAGQIL